MFGRILVPVDFSEYTEEILRYAKEMADRFGSSVHLLHVVPNIDYFTTYDSFMATENVEALQKSIEEDVKRQLDEAAAKVTGVAVTKAVRMGAAYVEIIAYAGAEGIDLIVMGTHGRGGIEHIVIGSVTEKVVRRAPCPVLTIRPPKGHAGTH